SEQNASAIRREYQKLTQPSEKQRIVMPESWLFRKKVVPLQRFSAQPLSGCRVPRYVGPGRTNNF
ncbi:MAG: hypothetical protein UHZ01_02025, partial [Prevotella sp.]|nr:hypothetical protein [Prevotella sp.]